MKEIKNIEAVLFDLDGVLIDSFEVWYSAFNDTLKKFMNKTITKEEFQEKHWGLSLKDNMDKLGLGKKAEDYCHSRYNKYIDQVKIIPGTESVLKIIKRKIGLVTSTPSDSTSKILNRFGLSQYFDATISSDEVENAKPSPEPILKACEILEVKPEKTIFVGDNETDVVAGKNAGCKVIGERIEGDLKIESIDELRDLLPPLKQQWASNSFS